MMDWMRHLLYLPERAAPIADKIDGLHFFVVSVSMLGGLSVILVTIYYAWHYRAGSGAGVYQPKRGTSMRFEIALGIGLMLLFLLWWAIGWPLYRSIGRPADPTQAQYTVEVIAKQWMWKFINPNGRVSVNELVLPVNTPVHLVLTSRDVIHSLYLPEFRLKRDAVPHGTTHLYFTPDRVGEYRVLCAEYCGLQHSGMRAVVRVLSAEDFARWRDRPAVSPDLIKRGRLAAVAHGCFTCHSINGSTLIGPSWLGRYGHTIALHDGTTLVVDNAYLTRSMMEPGREVAAGFDNVMPSFAGDLSASDAAAIVAYIRQLQVNEPTPQPRLEKIMKPLREQVGVER